MLESPVRYTHRFCLEDQMAFARLSGDYNPMHVDPQTARRLLYGDLVVHGLHLVLWSYDKVLARWPDAAQLERLRAFFMQPVLVNQEITVEVEQAGQHLIKGRVMVDDQALTEIVFSIGESAPHLAVDRGLFEGGHAIARAIEVLENDKGDLPLCIHPERLHSAFPHLAKTLDHGVAAVLLATTRLVGMICPGLHSLFTGLDLSFSDGDPKIPQHLMHYGVTRFDRRFNMLDLKVKGRKFHGKLNTFVRPSPTNQLSMTQAAMLMKGHSFRAQRALVVGGSRGLGEVTAKLLSAGGAHVTLTYSAGREDAENVAAAITAHGGTASSTRFDVLSGSDTAPQGPFTHIYYFASPRIVAGKRPPFDAELFKTYCAFFVDGLATLVSAMDGPITVFYPSTVFLDTPEKGFVEYAAAKAAGEALCRYLESERPDVTTRIVRLPRMRTDQTQAIFALKANDLAEPADIMRSVLMQEWEVDQDNQQVII
ncbi:MAG: SDR family NAD(P)-dependent oxidoreductase [Gammaproteobacteria bacterium]